MKKYEVSSIDYLNFHHADNELKNLNLACDRFIRSFRLSFSETVRVSAEISYRRVNKQFGQWSVDSTESCSGLLQLNGAQGRIIAINFDKKLAYSLIDTMAGGGGEQVELLQKEYTSLELVLLRREFELIVEELNEAWHPILPIGANLLRVESSSQLLGISSDNEKCAVIEYTINFGSRGGTLQFLFPYSVLFLMRERLF